MSVPIEIVMYMTYDVTIPSGTATTQRPESRDGRAEDESDIPSIISPSSVDILNRKPQTDRPERTTTMTEITLKLSGREAQQILDGLLQMGYDHGKRAEKEELRVTEHQMDENEIGERMASARAKSSRDKEAAAYSAYEKVKAEAMRLGLIF